MSYHRFHSVGMNKDQNIVDISMSEKETKDLRYNYKLFLKRHKVPQWEFKILKWEKDKDIYKGELPK